MVCCSTETKSRICSGTDFSVSVKASNWKVRDGVDVSVSAVAAVSSLCLRVASSSESDAFILRVGSAPYKSSEG